MKKIISLIIAVSIIVPGFAPFAHADTASAEAQLQSLLQELAQLQNQVNGSGTATPVPSSSPASTSFTFTRNLTVGSGGTDVSALQQILINDGYLTAISTPNGHFGPATKAALMEYQQANGISPATGYFGPLTMASINGKTGGGTSTSSASPVIANPPPSQDSLELVSVNYYTDSAGIVHADGQVKNIGSQSLQYVEAIATFNDMNNKFVEYEPGYLQFTTLNPGETSNFQIEDTGNPSIVIGNTTLTFEDGNGNEMPYVNDATPGSSTATTDSPVTNGSQTAQSNWSTYQPVDFNVYYENPGAYSGENIALLASPDDFLTAGPFLPAGDNGGVTNFIEMTDPSESGHPVIDAEIDSQSNYTAVVNALQPIGELPFVMIYGEGAPSQSFSMTNGTTQYFAVIKAARIDVCSQGIGMIDYGAGEPSASDCTTGWDTMFPAGVVSNTNTTVSQAITAPSNTTNNPRSFQLNVAGACQNDGDGTIILTGYPYADGYSIPSDDITEWSGGAVGFTVPSGMTAGTYQVDIRGYTPGVGTCPDVSGGTITVP